jgi:hypothetical protein
MRDADPSMPEPPSLTVIREIAEEKDIDPENIEPPLSTVIDTDALDRLFTGSEHTDGRVTFEYSGYSVTVDSDGDVEIDHAIAEESQHAGQGVSD